MVRSIVARTLKNHGCTVLEATSGEEGLEVTARERPDPDLGRTPIIMLTAESGCENVAFIARLGVRDYITKPFEEAKLLEKIGRIIPLDSPAAN